MKLFRMTIFIMISILPLNGNAQEVLQPDSLLNKLCGKWVLRGVIDGQNTVHDMEIMRVLNGQYLQIKEVSREKDKDGNPAYDALVYLCWEKPKQQYSCLWLDNTSNGGVSNGIVGVAKQNGDKIELIFTFSKSILFHTSFLYNKGSNNWQLVMDSEENGSIQPFARAQITRE